jgi:hypothetical protein
MLKGSQRAHLVYVHSKAEVVVARWHVREVLPAEVEPLAGHPDHVI